MISLLISPTLPWHPDPSPETRATGGRARVMAWSRNMLQTPCQPGIAPLPLAYPSVLPVFFGIRYNTAHTGLGYDQCHFPTRFQAIGDKRLT
jgi:hypothetical protein